MSGRVAVRARLVLGLPAARRRPVRASSAASASASSNKPILLTFPNKDILSQSLADFVIKAQETALATKGKFHLAISGGSLPVMLAKHLVGRTDDLVKWPTWDIWFSDERIVPLDDEDSNFYLCDQEFFSKTPLKREQVHTIDVTHLGDSEATAQAYEQELTTSFGAKGSGPKSGSGSAPDVPAFDLILLGMGPDGHTASLFPHHALLGETARLVAPVEDSPKPPPRRITFTYPVLNHAHRVAFVLAGEGKQDLLAQTLDHPSADLPAARVRPAPPGDVFFFTDAPAAAKVQYAPAQFKI